MRKCTEVICGDKHYHATFLPLEVSQLQLKLVPSPLMINMRYTVSSLQHMTIAIYKQFKEVLDAKVWRDSFIYVNNMYKLIEIKCTTSLTLG